MGGFSEAIASEWFEKGMARGQAEGRAVGQAEGRMETFVENVRAFMASGMTLEEVIRILKPDEETEKNLREKFQ